jgi:hypothetical protein
MLEQTCMPCRTAGSISWATPSSDCASAAAAAHPMAAEVVHWLDGADTVDGWVEQA